MSWPDPTQIKRGVCASQKRIEVILRIGSDALEAVGNDPDATVEQLADYEGAIQRILLDKSMGRGVGMKSDEFRPFIRAIKEAYPMLGIGIAGGLGPETTYLAEPLMREFPDLSRDAQGRLRPSGSALDPIAWDMAGTYLIKSLAQ
jgi:phosphoribosylanthranilate isomerase